MKYAVIFALLALILGAASLSSARGGDWFVSAIEAYVAIGLVELAVAYGLKQVGLPVEEISREPRWDVTNFVLLAPYRTVAVFCLSVTRRLDSEQSRSLISPGLLLGRFPSRTERRLFSRSGIDAVLNLCAEFSIPRPLHPGPREHCVPILDGSPPTDRQFREAIEWIEARRDEGLTILIHCAQGHGRSATVAAVALCRLGLAPDLDDAISLIRAARPKAQPSKGQRLAALRFIASSGTETKTRGAGLSTRPLA